MNLQQIGRTIRERRRLRGWTLAELAAAAGIARSTLAALEAGTLTELGYNRVARVCAALDLVVEARAPRLAKPLIEHRHLTDLAGRELTKAAIDDVVSRGDMVAWRGLLRAAARDGSGLVRRRIAEVLRAKSADEPRARALAALLRTAGKAGRRAGGR